MGGSVLPEGALSTLPREPEGCSAAAVRLGLAPSSFAFVPDLDLGRCWRQPPLGTIDELVADAPDYAPRPYPKSLAAGAVESM